MNKVTLTDEQRNLVAGNLDIVKWVIRSHITVNENLHGLSYDDLFQEGCILLSKAAVSYDSNMSQFVTYAQVVVRNGLFTYCKRVCGKQKKQVSLDDTLVDGGKESFADSLSTGDIYGSFTSDLVTFGFLESVKSEYEGIARLGIEALELKAKGYTGADVARLWGVKQNHVGAWISRAKKKLKENERFVKGFLVDGGEW